VKARASRHAKRRDGRSTAWGWGESDAERARPYPWLCQFGEVSTDPELS
jgi:hypothetical protein